MKRDGKKIAAGFVIMLMTVILIGCSKAEPVTAEEFAEVMENRGFTVSDCTEQFEDENFIKKVLVAVSPTGDYQVKFLTLEGEEAAKDIYEETCEILSTGWEQTSIHESSGSQKQNYEIIGTDGFGCMTRIGATCFYAVVDEDFKKQVEEIKNELGY